MPKSFRICPQTGIAAIVGAVMILSIGLPAVVAADNHPIKIHRLGNPNSAISKTPARSVADVQRLAKEFENALKVALAQSDFDGDPQDLMDAIARGDGEMVSVNTGDTYEWMVFRKRGQPAISSRAVEWAGRKPLDAYRLNVASGRYVYTFDIPLTCINLALVARQDAPPPSCTLEASASTPDGYDVLGDISVRATGDGPVRLTSIAGPAGAIDPGQARSTGTNAWTLKPAAPGRHTFTATVSDDYGREATCTANATVAPAKKRPVPVCNLGASYNDDTGAITIDAGGSRGTVRITGVTLADGTSGDVAALTAAGDNTWTFTPKVPRKPGDYTYRFTAESNLPDAAGPANCDASTTITRTGPDGRWILRAFGASINGDDEVSTDTGVEQTFVNLGKGAGVGLALEYLFSDRWGIEGGFIFGGLDSDIFLDQADFWGMDEEDVSFQPLMLGINYHLTPGRRADLYIGPFIALVNYGSATFEFPIGNRRVGFDDDFGVGAQLGVDVPFGGSRWGFNGALRYLQTVAEEDGGLGREFDIDPLILSAGVGFRF